ncbi:MAG: hypothetical protein ACEPO8_15275 [Rhodothermaceae bacterium]
MIKKIINKISYARLSGIKKIIYVEQFNSKLLIKGIENTSSVFSFFKDASYENLSEKFNLVIQNPDEFSSAIKKAVSEFDFDDAVIVWGLSDFRHSLVSLSTDVEDTEIWFLDNQSQFLPQNQSADDFGISARELYSDSDNIWYTVVVTRKNFLEKITELVSKTDLTLAAILPFSLPSVISYEETEETLLIILRDNKLYTIYKGSENRFKYEEVFLLNQKDSELYQDEINEKLKLFVSGFQSHNSSVKICLDIPDNSVNITVIKQIIKDALQESVFSKKLNSTLLNVKSLDNNFDDKLNLLSSEAKSSNSFRFDKEITNKLVISLGGVLVILLLGLYILEGQILSGLDESNSAISELKSKEKLITTKKNNISALKNNLNLLYKLQERGAVNSVVLKNISKVMPLNSQLLKVNIDKRDEKQIRISVEGITNDQTNIPQIIKNIEEIKGYQNATLVYSKMIKRKKIKNPKIRGSEFIIFCIRSEAYVD